jgi:hypothetical protein
LQLSATCGIMSVHRMIGDTKGAVAYEISVQ